MNSLRDKQAGGGKREAGSRKQQGMQGLPPGACRLPPASCLLFFLCIFLSCSLAAQNPHPGGPRPPLPITDPSGSLAGDPHNRLQAPTALLDDYDGLPPGTLSITTGGGYAKVPVGFDATVPSFDLAFGLTRRISLHYSSGYVQSAYESFRITAMGDAYVSGKIVLLREKKHRPGVAFEPVLEILGRPSLAENLLAPSKVNGAFGGIVGKEFYDTIRIYNHSGYFTRGIMFSSTALDVTRFSHFTPTAFANVGSLTKGRDLAASLQLNVSRVDVGGGLGFAISKRVSVFGSVGRSVGRRDNNSNVISVNGGISYTWNPWSK